jgi:hypothetical protein
MTGRVIGDNGRGIGMRSSVPNPAVASAPSRFRHQSRRASPSPDRAGRARANLARAFAYQRPFADFDSAIPRFESWRPSQPVRSLRCDFQVWENRRHSQSLLAATAQNLVRKTLPGRRGTVGEVGLVARMKRPALVAQSGDGGGFRALPEVLSTG